MQQNDPTPLKFTYNAIGATIEKCDSIYMAFLRKMSGARYGPVGT